MLALARAWTETQVGADKLQCRRADGSARPPALPHAHCTTLRSVVRGMSRTNLPNAVMHLDVSSSSLCVLILLLLL